MLSSQKNKLCFVSIFAYPLFDKSIRESFGGSEVQLYQISRILAKEAMVSFVVGDYGQECTKLIDGVRVIKSFPIKKNILGLILAPMRLWRALSKGNAEIYVQRAAGFETGIVSLFCFLKRRKFIYMTAHEIDCSGEFRRLYSLKGIVYEWGIRHANLIAVQNKEQKKLLKDRYGIEALLMRSGFAIPAKNEFDKNGTILYVSRRDKWKQPELLMDLARRFPERVFVMVANAGGDRIYTRLIEEQAKKIDNIKFIEKVSLDEANELFRCAYLFINTSKYEGFPNTFIQAAMHAVPIISFSVNPENIITRYNIGYCADGNFEIMLQQMSEILNSDDNWKMKSGNAYLYAKNNHGIDKIGKEWQDIIKNLT